MSGANYRMRFVFSIDTTIPDTLIYFNNFLLNDRQFNAFC